MSDLDALQEAGLFHMYPCLSVSTGLDHADTLVVSAFFLVLGMHTYSFFSSFPFASFSALAFFFFFFFEINHHLRTTSMCQPV